MSLYLLDFWIDGYENEKEGQEAEKEFIYEQLNMPASSVKIKNIDEFLNKPRPETTGNYMAGYFDCIEDLKRIFQE